MGSFFVKAQNPTVEAFRIEALKRGMLPVHAFEQAGALVGMPSARLRGWLGGQYRLTPANTARVAQACSQWLRGTPPPETIVRWIKAARLAWIEHERAKLQEADGEWWAMALQIYLQKPLEPVSNGEVLEEQAEPT